jgi:hypothetical protein
MSQTVDVDRTAPVIKFLDTGNGRVPIDDPQHCPTIRDGKEFLRPLKPDGVCLWLSTAGMGVSWLHVRLDSSLKYYGYKPFKQTH